MESSNIKTGSHVEENHDEEDETLEKEETTTKDQC
jgi:hypothetical protein